MMSFSLMFHLASAVVFLILSVVYARERSRVQFLRRWVRPNSGFMVAEPERGLRLFASALGIEIEVEHFKKSDLVKLKLFSLMAIHSRAQILMIRISEGSPIKVELTLGTKVPIDSVELSNIERDFSDKIQVVIGSFAKL